MALPILNTQTFELNIPSTDEKIKYRPFLVKEEKILLQAQEGTGDEVTDSILQIVDNCTFGKINVEQLNTIHDLGHKYEVFQEFGPDTQTWYHETFYKYLKNEQGGLEMQKKYQNTPSIFNGNKKI